MDKFKNFFGEEDEEELDEETILQALETIQKICSHHISSKGKSKVEETPSPALTIHIGGSDDKKPEEKETEEKKNPEPPRKSM